MANSASNLLGTVSAAQLSGTVPLVQLPVAIVTNNASNVNISGSFTGNGGGLTNLNAASLSGVILDYPRANTALGFQALTNSIGGGGNTSLGYQALRNNVNGIANTADGMQTLYSNVSGSYNTANGNQALYQNTSGNNNIGLGNFAGYFTTGNYNIDIGNQGQASDNNIIRIGDPAVHTSTYIAGVIYGNGANLTSLNANNLAGGTVPVARLGGITSNQLDAVTWQLATNNQLDAVAWQLATNLNGGNAALATNVVAGLAITNAFITNSVFAGNGAGLTNLNASQMSSGTMSLAQLPGAVVTNNWAGKINGSALSLGGNLYLPASNSTNGIIFFNNQATILADPGANIFLRSL